MILTQCAVCATELGLTLGKKCGRCSTRYCGPECQVQHWKDGGHDTLCKKIKRAGGAEQYNANKKYAAAVTVAAEACAEHTKGQTCYICTQALHWKTKEGLVRNCACHGTAGFAHVSCLAEQAKIWCDEAEADNLDPKVKQARFNRWHTCSLCEQSYLGVVRCALGWACWKTYAGRPEADQTGLVDNFRVIAMGVLGSGLSEAQYHEDALPVKEAELAYGRRHGLPERLLLPVQSNLATTYAKLGRREEALRMRQDVYSRHVEHYGEEHGDTLAVALCYATSLFESSRFEEARSLSRKTMLLARRVLGENDDRTLRMRWNYARTLYENPGATIDDVREAVTTLEETERTARRVLGGAHPSATVIGNSLRESRVALLACEMPDDLTARLRGL